MFIEGTNQRLDVAAMQMSIDQNGEAAHVLDVRQTRKAKWVDITVNARRIRNRISILECISKKIHFNIS